MVLHLVLKKSLAFFASVGLSDRSRYLFGFFVLVFVFNDEFPLCTESILGHACILYESVFKNTRYCGQKRSCGDIRPCTINVIERRYAPGQEFLLTATSKHSE